jgi:hypothetical protein
MKTKWFLWICFVLVVFAGCEKKSDSPPAEPAAQMTQSQPESRQAASEEPAQPATESVSVEARAEKDQQDETEYFAVFLEGKKAGYARQDRVVSDGKVTSSEQVSLTISRAGVSMTVTMNVKMVETIDGKPLGFETVQDLGMMKMEISGTVQPDGKLALVNRSAGSEQKSVVDWPSGALMTEGLRLLLESKGLKEGTEYSCSIFEPTMVRALDAKTIVGTKEQVDLLGRVVTLTEVKNVLGMAEMGEIASTSYYDDDLNLLKSITPIMGMAMEMVACPKEFAMGENDVVELVNKMFIDSPTPLENLESAESITYHLNPTAGAELVIPPNDNQQVETSADGKVIITVKPVAAPSGVTFPYKGDDKEALEHLEPTQFVQSDDERIVELARRAVGSTKDAREAIEKIEAFVAEYVEDKNLSVGYASAVEVARSKQGDCSEHAVLAAALCRAVGIPAQVVTGLAYVGEWRDVASGFGGHAWTQAYLGGKWVGLDAAFRGADMGGYDAGHIALAAGKGDPGDFFSLVTTMGQFKIDKAIVKRK